MTSSLRLELEDPQARARAADYERLAVRGLFAGWARRLVNQAALPREARIADVGCGTGIVARLAADTGDSVTRVVGIDADPAMLQVAREVSARAGLRIRWLQADATRLPLPPAAFDVVFCQQALQFFDQPHAALAEMHRILRPGGTVAIDTWRGVRDPEAARALRETFVRALGPDAAGELEASCSFGTPESLIAALVDAGFEVIDAGVFVDTVALDSGDEILELAALITSLGPWLDRVAPHARGRLGDALDRALGNGRDGPRLPVEAAFAIGRR